MAMSFEDYTRECISELNKAVLEIKDELAALKKEKAATPATPSFPSGLPHKGSITIDRQDDDSRAKARDLMRAWALIALDYRATGTFTDAGNITVNRTQSEYMRAAYRLATKPKREASWLGHCYYKPLLQWVQDIFSLSDLIYGTRGRVALGYHGDAGDGKFAAAARDKKNMDRFVTLEAGGMADGRRAETVSLTWDIGPDSPFEPLYLHEVYSPDR